MITLFGILAPQSGAPRPAIGPAPLAQKPFFSRDPTHAPDSRIERDAALLAGKGEPYPADIDGLEGQYPRFVSYFAPPYC